VVAVASVLLVGWLAIARPLDAKGWQTADALPPPWSERPITLDDTELLVVGRGAAAPTEDAALALARDEAVEVLLHRVVDDLRGRPVHPFLEARGIADGSHPFGRAAVDRYESQLGAEAGLARVAVAFHVGEGVEAVGQYRLDRARYDAVVAEYGRAVSFGGATVVRMFPGLADEIDTRADLVVIEGGSGLVPGDLLLGIGGKSVGTLDEVEAVGVAAWRDTPAGGTLPIEVESGGTTRVVALEKPKIGG
jgi:hypothetical protein